MNRLLTMLCIVAIAAGCSDDPGEIGKGLISANDLLNLDSLTVYAVQDTTFLARVNGPGNTMVGRYADLEARALMAFTGFNSVPATAHVDSAILTIATNYKFKDSAGTVGFEVHEMNFPWGEGSFRWDSSLV